jgi:hypothetical protein
MSLNLSNELVHFIADYWSVLLAYAFPSLLTFLVGISVILATAKVSQLIFESFIPSIESLQSIIFISFI